VQRDAREVCRHGAAFGRDAVERQQHGRGDVQPLGLAADPQAGLVEVLYRRRRDARVDGGGEALKPRGAILAHGGDGRRRQLHAEQVRHQRGEALLGQKLAVQEINHDAGNPGAILHRGLHIRGKVRTGLGAARRAAATVGAVLGHDEGLRLWKVEHLPGYVVRRHRFAQRLAAPRAGFGEMIDRGIDALALAQGLAGMSLLSARLLAGPFAQTADANRLLLQAVAGRRFPAVAAVQAQLAFQFGDPRLQLRDSGLLRRVLVPQYRIDRCRILGNRRGFVARIVCRRTGHTMVGVRLLPLPQHLIHLSSQFAAPNRTSPSWAVTFFESGLEHTAVGSLR
jgi:hypothetical protein